MNHTFRDHVTSTKFPLTLSRSMIFHLLKIESGEQFAWRKELDAAGLTDTSVPTRGRLSARGLVYAPDSENPGIYQLTTAGQLVCSLLREAGLHEEFEA